VHVPSLLVVAASAPPYWPAGVDAICRPLGDEPVVLVPHSNAGLYVPAVIDRLGEQVRGVVFVDAALPSTGHLTTPEFLRRLVTTDGLLPPWTAWWDEADVADLFPDAETRAEVEAEQPRMPLGYYDHLPPARQDWAALPCGYLWFGAPYDQEAAQAAASGWPTAQLPGNHLHMLTDPDAAAGAILQMTADWR
jgi:pimeloyl-ACP methyl ester carboxylesterase